MTASQLVDGYWSTPCGECQGTTWFEMPDGERVPCNACKTMAWVPAVLAAPASASDSAVPQLIPLPAVDLEQIAERIARINRSAANDLSIPDADWPIDAALVALSLPPVGRALRVLTDMAARHVPVKLSPDPASDVVVCRADRKAWPCDDALIIHSRETPGHPRAEEAS